MEVIGSFLLGVVGIMWTVVGIHLIYGCWWKPESCRIKLRKQGIKGPLPHFLLGNIPEMNLLMSQTSHTSGKIDGPLTVFPYFAKWTNNYGRLFKFALGKIQLVYVSKPEIVKELRVYRSLDLGKPAYLQNERGALLGKGLITTNGAVWSHQRKTISPQLYLDKVKDMLELMVESGLTLVKSWEKIVETEGGMSDIMVDDYVRSFTSYITSKMVFGHDHKKGIKIFPKCQALIKAMGTATTLGLPFSRFLPTKSSRDASRLSKEIHGMIMDIVKERARTNTSHRDILQVILEGSKTGELRNLTEEEFIVDNCKDIFLAAYEVTAIAAIWGLMLLASNREWQDRARSEVLEVCGGQQPSYDQLSRMTLLKTVIQEALRLYPGVAFVSREALEDVKLGDLQVPKGVGIWIWMLALHRDPELWGPDADKFNPGRFADGISGACKSSEAYIPFGFGARVCPGQKLAVVALKVLFAMVLSNFKLTISPKYRHSPKFKLLLDPEYGVNVIVQRI